MVSYFKESCCELRCTKHLNVGCELAQQWTVPSMCKSLNLIHSTAKHLSVRLNVKECKSPSKMGYDSC